MIVRKLGWNRVISVSVLTFIWLGAASMAFEGDEAKPPSATEGQELSEKFCKACHLINGQGGGTAQVGPPSFASIANRPGQTAQHIKNVLIQPHAPMPDMHFSNEEILNIIAYLETLRTDPTIPPLLPPKGEGKPKFPKPT